MFIRRAAPSKRHVIGPKCSLQQDIGPKPTAMVIKNYFILGLHEETKRKPKSTEDLCFFLSTMRGTAYRCSSFKSCVQVHLLVLSLLSVFQSDVCILLLCTVFSLSSFSFQFFKFSAYRSLSYYGGSSPKRSCQLFSTRRPVQPKLRMVVFDFFLL